MTRGLRIFVALALSVMLVFTSHSMAVARGMPGADGQMVICTGHGPVMISVDANGDPTGPPHLCPDAALSLIKTLLMDASLIAPAPQTYQQIVGLQTAPGGGAATAAPHARDPPLAI